jgi:hypothetical protein
MTTRLAPPEGDSNVAVHLQQNQGIPSPLIADFPVPENAPFRVVKVLVLTSKATFQCMGSNLGTDADLIPLRRDFGPLGINDLRGQNRGVRYLHITQRKKARSRSPRGS